MENFTNYENEIFNELPRIVIGCNFKSCTFNAYAIIDKSNLENCTINVGSKFLHSNLINCNLIAQDCTFKHSNIMQLDETNLPIDLAK